MIQEYERIVLSLFSNLILRKNVLSFKEKEKNTSNNHQTNKTEEIYYLDSNYSFFIKYKPDSNNILGSLFKHSLCILQLCA